MIICETPRHSSSSMMSKYNGIHKRSASVLVVVGGLLVCQWQEKASQANTRIPWSNRLMSRTWHCVSETASWQQIIVFPSWGRLTDGNAVQIVQIISFQFSCSEVKHCVHYMYGDVSVRLECAQTILFLVLLIDYCPHRHLFTGLWVDWFSLSITFVENLVVVCSHASLR